MDGFKWKAGISLVAESSLNVRLKRKQKSLASRDHSLRYGAQDFSVNNYMDLFTFKQENRYKITESFETLVNSLFEFTAQFDHPRLLVGVRLNGPKNLPIIERLDFNEGKGPILATGFHRSGWSLAWEAGDLVAEILQK
jgi:glycine/D-amino acid oxidase-like deaminating enzyme